MTKTHADDSLVLEDVVPAEELAPLHEHRASVYNLLGRIYRTEIDQAFLEQMRDMMFPMLTGSDLMDDGYRQIATYLSNLRSGSLTELAVDYVRCFIGHGIDAYSAAYPFESVYTSEKRLMMQDARDEVLAIYRSEHLNKSDAWKEGEDHIALELEFMGTLANRTAAALRSENTEEAARLTAVQKGFLDDHLCAWAPMLTKDMRSFAQTEFYSGVANLTEGFLALDGEFMAELAV